VDKYLLFPLGLKNLGLPRIILSLERKIMFIGEYSYTIDAKGRLALPVKFRSYLASGGIVTRGLDNCLFLYPQEEWDKLAQKLANLPLADSSARAFVRLMLAGAMEVSLDRQGRIIIPGYLRNFAQFKNNIIVAGIYNRIELWEEENWKHYQSIAEKGSNDLAQALSDLGV
jgi:MraZ protein